MERNKLVGISFSSTITHIIFHIIGIVFLPLLTDCAMGFIPASLTTIFSVTSTSTKRIATNHAYFSAHMLPSFLLNDGTREKMYSDCVKYEPTKGGVGMPPYSLAVGF